jgi:pyridoxamine 5'-phosphate oxidase
MTGLISGDFVESSDPFALFADWFAEAKAAEPNDPNAMALATVDATACRTSAWCCLKQADERGFVFYTNDRKREGRRTGVHPESGRSCCTGNRCGGRSACTRSRGARHRRRGRRLFRLALARLAHRAWASDQSRPAGQPLRLSKRVSRSCRSSSIGKDVPRPAHWTGYRIVPVPIEFWQDRAVPPARPRSLHAQSDTNSQWRKRGSIPE